MTILLYIIVFITSAYSVLFPWIGVLAYYLLALLFPQGIWAWIFEDIRVTLYISIATILGFIVSSPKLDFSILKHKQNLFLAILWVAFIVSYFFSPYGANNAGYSVFNSDMLLSSLSKILFFYFIAITLMNSRRKLHFLIMVIIITIIYYTFWTNEMYLSGQMTDLGISRLGGTLGRGSMYSDENTFAMLFVMGIPFLYFMGYYYKSKLLKLLLWLAIPFAWHAVFLTGSRGGMIGLGVVTLFIAVRSKKKTIGLVVLSALLIAFIWQGGILKERMIDITDYEEDGSAMGRIEAWSAGIKMALDHPITGVGPGNFAFVLNEYTGNVKRKVAHNTVIQLASENGFLAGLMYLLLVLNVFIRYFKREKILLQEGKDPFLLATNNAIFCSLAGFFVCSLLLNLATYEVFYYILVLNIAEDRLVEDAEHPLPFK